MKIARFMSLTLAAAAMVLHVGAAQAAMKTQWIDYKQGNSVLSGYLVYDDAIQGRRPGVLMIHDRGGFSAKTLGDAEMISKLGYVVFAEDIYGKGVVPKTTPEMVEQTEIYENDLPLMRAPWRVSMSSRPSRWLIRRRWPRSATALAAWSESN